MKSRSVLFVGAALALPFAVRGAAALGSRLAGLAVAGADRLSAGAARLAERVRLGQVMAAEAAFVKALYDVAYLKMTSNESVGSGEVLDEVARFAGTEGPTLVGAGSDGPVVHVSGPAFSYLVSAPSVVDRATGRQTLSIVIAGQGLVEGFSVAMAREGSSKAEISPDVLAVGAPPADSDAARLAEACMAPFCQRPRMFSAEEFDALMSGRLFFSDPSMALETLRERRRRDP